MCHTERSPPPAQEAPALQEGGEAAQSKGPAAPAAHREPRPSPFPSKRWRNPHTRLRIAYKLASLPNTPAQDHGACVDIIHLLIYFFPGVLLEREIGKGLRV